jgi:hypothetical protein
MYERQPNLGAQVHDAEGLNRERAARNLAHPLASANYKARTARSARYNKHSKKGQAGSETHDVFVPRGIRCRVTAQAKTETNTQAQEAGAPFVLVFPLRSLPRPTYPNHM